MLEMATHKSVDLILKNADLDLDELFEAFDKEFPLEGNILKKPAKWVNSVSRAEEVRGSATIWLAFKAGVVHILNSSSGGS